MMLGVNGQPFISFDNELDLSVMQIIHNEMCIGLAMVNGSHERCQCLKGHNEAVDLYDYRYKDYAALLPEDVDMFNLMNPEQQRKFMLIKYGVYFPWTHCIRFLEPNSWPTKHSSAGKTIPNILQSWFPKTIEWCYSLPMFSEIGRMNVFGVHPNNPVSCHRDKNPAEWLIDDEFVMILPVLKKPLYVYDDVKKEKHYINCHVAAFNDLDYHGADATTEFSYTIRIDGVFTPEYKERVKYGRYK